MYILCTFNGCLLHYFSVLYCICVHCMLLLYISISFLDLYFSDISHSKRPIVNSVEMYEEQLTQKSLSNQAAFLLVSVANLFDHFEHEQNVTAQV